MGFHSQLDRQTVIPIACLASYGVLSLIGTLLQRIIMSKCFYDYPIAILMAQMGILFGVLEIIRITNIKKVQSYSMERFKETVVPSLMYAFSCYLTLNAVEGMVMPLFPSIKRFCPIATLLVSSYFFRRQPPSSYITSLILAISLGGFLTNLIDMTFDIRSIVYGILAFVMQAFSLVMFKDLLQKMSVLDLLYCNSFNCLTILLLTDIIQDEIRDSIIYIFTSGNIFFFTVSVFLIICGVAVQFLIMYCLEYTGAVAVAVTANVRSAIQIYVAYWLSVNVYYDIYPGILNFYGLSLTVGAAVYLAYKTQQRRMIKSELIIWP